MVSTTGNICKEKSRNRTNISRIKKGLRKKAFEFSTPVEVDSCSTTGVVVGGSKKNRYNRCLKQKNPAEITSCREQDDYVWSAVEERAMIQALKTLIPKGKDVILITQRHWEQIARTVPGKKMTGNQCKKKFALLMKGGFSFDSEIEEEEEIKNEFMDLHLL